MRNGFSEAVETKSAKMSLCVRPKEIKRKALDVLAGDDFDMKEEFITQEELDDTEARAIPGQKMIYRPTKVEWDDHNRTHFPFRKWCPFCVRGKCRSGAHVRQSESE